MKIKCTSKLILALIVIVCIIIVTYRCKSFQYTNVLDFPKDALIEKFKPNSEDEFISPISSSQRTSSTSSPQILEPYRMSVGVICCGGDRLLETQTSLTSVVLFSSSPLELLVFTEPQYYKNFSDMHKSWPSEVQLRVSLILYNVDYPPMVNEAEWRKLFRPCASLRLFLPDLLKDVDSLVYLDTDVLFLSAVEDTWKLFYLMSSAQLAGVTPEHQNKQAGWYNRFAKHPYYGELGINSGVMLMNLTRMRSFGWTDYIIPLKKQYEKSIRWGDQDILNILFHFHPELVYEMDCSYNYRPDHCMYGSVCPTIEREGVRLLHANRRSAHVDKFPPFRDTYQAMKKFELGKDDILVNLFKPLTQKFTLYTNKETCSPVAKSFLIQVLNYKV